MKILITVLIIALLHPVLAQDNSSPIDFDPGAIAFTNDPILPVSDHADKDVYPVIPDMRIMSTASYDVGNTYDGWMNGALTWLGMNTSLPANVSRNNLSLQVA
jgi:hypothetical protein